MIIEYNGKKPRIAEDVFIAPTAVILGDVEIGRGASIWVHGVLKGDKGKGICGCHTNIQDNCTVHTDFGKPAVIGDNVTVGHNAVIHGCTLENNSLIGMGAVVLNNAVVGQGAIVAAGSVVREKSRVSPWCLAAGVPAKEKKRIKPLPAGSRSEAAQDYMDLSVIYRREAVGNDLP